MASFVVERLGKEVEMSGCKGPITTFIAERLNSLAPHSEEFYMNIVLEGLGSGIRMTLHLGPSGAGKTARMSTLANIPNKDLRVMSAREMPFFSHTDNHPKQKDEVAGEVPVAFVVRSATEFELTEEVVKEYITKQGVFYKKLHKVYFVDAIPMSPAGKILRKELREKLAAGITPSHP